MGLDRKAEGKIKTMFDWSDITGWTLKAGSHDFPGPQGGTCINEAAIVAAGFKYKAVGSARDCPPCFSRPIAAYAIQLNDRMYDKTRNELLMPFVTRLAGTADTPEVERDRVHHMAIRGVNLILPIVLRAAGREAEALKCERVTTLDEARTVAAEVRNTLPAAADAAAAAYAAAYAYAAAAAYAAAYAYADAYAAAAADAAADAAAAAYAAAYAYADAAADAAAAAAAAAARRSVWLASVQILDEAIRMGNQGDTISVDLAVERMTAARQLAPA